MQEFQINDIKKLCFLVKKGTAKNIVITYDSLADIDLKRFFDMEKQGGELMRVMRDTTLDNGVNALVMYADMLIDVDVIKPKEPAANVTVPEKEEVKKATPKTKRKSTPRAKK